MIGAWNLFPKQSCVLNMLTMNWPILIQVDNVNLNQEFILKSLKITACIVTYSVFLNKGTCYIYCETFIN